MVSDSSFADYVSETLSSIDMLQDSELGAVGKNLFLSSHDAEFLTQIREDLDKLPEAVRSSSGAALCRRFVEDVGMALASVPGARCAVFGDEEDGVELVAHSRASKRQVSFQFDLSVGSITVVRIDEEMRRSEDKCRIDHELQLAKAIEWLNRAKPTIVGSFWAAPEEIQATPVGVSRDDALRQQGQRSGDSPTSMSAAQRIAELRAWIATHPRLPYEADDSRESIYEGRGE